MRKVLLVIAAVFALSACVSIDGAYEDHARRECDRETSAAQRGSCYDRVDQNRRGNP
jgi:hypothetical protein